jgi:hypothetical protein
MSVLLAAGARTVLLEVGLVLLALVVVLWALQRRARGAGRHRKGPVVALTPQHALHVVDIEGRRFLVGTGPTGAPRLLSKLDRHAGCGEVRLLREPGAKELDRGA